MRLLSSGQLMPGPRLLHTVVSPVAMLGSRSRRTVPWRATWQQSKKATVRMLSDRASCPMAKAQSRDSQPGQSCARGTLGNVWRHYLRPSLIYAAVSGVRCSGTRDPFLAGTDSLAVARGLQSTRALVVARGGLSCSEACGILVPLPGIKPMSPALEGGCLTIGPPGKSLET